MLVLLSVGPLAACDGTPTQRRAPDAVVTDAGPVPEPLPRFRGSLPVTLWAGRPVYSEEGCTPESGSDRVCDPSGERTYLLIGAGRKARLSAARMVLDEGGTSWTARFDLADARGGAGGALRQTTEEARETGAAVLVLDEWGTVLVAAGVPDVSGRQIRFTGLSKSEAWRLVEPTDQR